MRYIKQAYLTLAITIVTAMTVTGCAINSADQTLPAPDLDHFTAQGQEPAWALEIDDDDAQLSLDYDERRLDLDINSQRQDGNVTRLLAHDGATPVTIEITPKLCHDSMSGMPYPNSVGVSIGGDELSGCGGDPAELLTKGQWQVTQIDERDTLSDHRPTLSFDADGQVAGSASCNRWFSHYQVSGEGLAFSHAGATKMFCSPQINQQEDLFLKTLGQVERFDIAPNGELVLYAADNKKIIAELDE